jgi:hypothetical protein
MHLIKLKKSISQFGQVFKIAIISTKIITPIIPAKTEKIIYKVASALLCGVSGIHSTHKII